MIRLMRQCRGLLTGLLLLVPAAACTPYVQRVYEGDPRPDEEIALFSTADNVDVVEVDGKAVSATTLQILPGPHRVRVVVADSPLSPLILCLPTDNQTLLYCSVISTADTSGLIVEFEAEAGHRYLATGSITRFPEGTKISFRISDEATGRTVARVIM